MIPLLSLAELVQERTPYLGARVRVCAHVDPSMYYNYGYRKAQETHAAYRLTDGSCTGYAYVARGTEIAARLALLEPTLGDGARELTVFVDPTREKGRGLVIGEIEAVEAEIRPITTLQKEPEPKSTT